MGTYIESLLKLSRNERFLIVQALLDSLQEEEKSGVMNLSDDWEAEIARRSDHVDEGKAKLLTREEAMGKYRKKFK